MYDEMLLELSDVAASDRSLAGSKAASLAVLRQAGFPVPDGIVMTIRAFEAYAALGKSAAIALPAMLRSALDLLADRYGDIPVAVRSSAVAEDLPGATFAGLYETVLDVLGPTAIEDAVYRCWASLDFPEAAAYRREANASMPHAMAVLIQPMVAPETAGVALSADPVTGDRSRALISAVRGLAAPLVSGRAVSEDWDVSATTVTCRLATGPDVLTAVQAAAVGAVLRNVEDLLGGPQDLEWAIADGQVLILQARPMTALPADVTWPVPPRGVWRRDIRLGELLPEPITPLFETWLLERLEERFRLRQRGDGGVNAPPPLHVSINNWYFHSPIGSGHQTVLFWGLLRRPRLALATILASRRPALSDRLFFSTHAKRWQGDVLAPYQQAVADSGRRVPAASAADLVQIVDHLADLAGDFFWSFVLLGGTAWRFEIALARFHRRHVRTKVSLSYQVLLGGLGVSDTPGHAVHSLDWFRETIGELPPAARRPKLAAARHDEAVGSRRAGEAACREALHAQPRLLARFVTLLTLAQRYAAIRADQAAWFTLAWPVLRQCARRLGDLMTSAGLLDKADDIFFISRAELGDYLAGHRPQKLAARTRDRRNVWDQSRRLSPPQRLGKAPLLLDRVLLSSPKVARPAVPAGSSAMRGTPASPGSAAGPVRVLRDTANAQSVLPGDVLVVAAAVPALTPVFDRIAALCVDGGSVAAHTSLITREYGIPTVIGLGDATSRLTDNTWVFVDGTAGVVDVR